MSAFTAQAKAQELKQRLQLQMPTASIVTSYDVNGYPLLSISGPSLPDASADSAQLKILVDPATSAPNGQEQGRVDGLGLSQRLYSPHIIEMILSNDQNSTGAAPNFTNHEAQELQARIVSSAGKCGLKMIIAYDPKATLAALTSATFDAAFAALQAASPAPVVIRSDEINPMTQSS